MDLHVRTLSLPTLLSADLVAELLVADDVDLADLRLRSFGDFEDDVDAVLVERDHLGLDGRGEAALPLVELDDARDVGADFRSRVDLARSEEHTSELQSLMRSSYAVFCLNNKTTDIS